MSRSPDEVRDVISYLLANHSSAFRCTFISTSVLHSILSLTAVVGNVLVLVTILNGLSVRKPAYALLVCLAISDLGVGLVCHPLYVVWKVNWLVNGMSDSYFKISKVLKIISTYFASVSFLTVTAVSCERFLALHYHLRYEDIITTKRLLAVVLFPWGFAGLLTILEFLFGYVDFYAQIGLIPICLLITALVYFKIYAILRRHRNQIKAQEQAMNHVRQGTAVNKEFDVQTFRKSATNMMFVYFVLLACYIPHFIVFMVYSNKYTLEAGILRNFTLTGVYLSSSLNPILYCCRLSVIRHEIRKLFLLKCFSTSVRPVANLCQSRDVTSCETNRERSVIKKATCETNRER